MGWGTVPEAGYAGKVLQVYRGGWRHLFGGPRHGLMQAFVRTSPR